MEPESFKRKLHEIIFEADTRAGKLFDVVLFIAIMASIIVVAIETVPGLGERYRQFFLYVEYFFTFIFTLEYIARLYSSNNPKRYAFSFYGVVDLVSILPTYLVIFVSGVHSLMFIRLLRLLRVFRVFKLAGFLNEGAFIMESLRASKQKIAVFMYFIMIIVSIFGALMYFVEGTVNESFDSIPRSIYWAIVTLTTVGYGDISPMTSIGQFLSSIIMILGYAVIAVPTGIVSSAMVNKVKKDNLSTQVCSNCYLEGHDKDAHYCKRCGHSLDSGNEEEAQG